MRHHPFVQAGQQYTWYVSATDGIDSTQSMRRFTFSTQALPLAFELDQNYPNPASSSAHIRYTVPETADVEITLYDVLGRKVATLVQQPHHAAGVFTLVLSSDQLSRLAAGSYLYEMRARGSESGRTYRKARMMVLVH